MPALQTTPPALEPVSLADAKAHLRLDGTDEDSLVARLITAARRTIEQRYNLAIIQQNWTCYADTVPSNGCLTLPIGPVSTITAVTLYDADNTAHVQNTDAYTADLVSHPARVRFTSLPPRTVRALNGIAIDIVAGFGPNPADVPGDIVQAHNLLMAHWFENRELPLGELGNDTAQQLDNLLKPYKAVRL